AWANCHGSFALGLAILLAAVAGTCWRIDRWRPRRNADRALAARLCVVAGLCMLTPFVNPFGPALVFYPLNVLGAQPDNIGNVAEWAALDLFESRGIGLVVALGVAAIMTFRRHKAVTIYEWAALLITAAMSIR